MHIKRGDLIAIALVLGLLVAAILGAILTNTMPRTNLGFGPEWDCKSGPYGEPICRKRPLSN
jgi:hypothetical protein